MFNLIRHGSSALLIIAIAATATTAEARGFFFKAKPSQPSPAMTKALVPANGSAQYMAGRMQVREGQQKVREAAGFLRGAAGMKMQAIGLQLQGNKQQANRMEFGAKQKMKAFNRRLSGSKDIASGLGNQAGGRTRVAADKMGNAVNKKVGQPVRNARVNATDSIANTGGRIEMTMRGLGGLLRNLGGAIKASAAQDPKLSSRGRMALME